MKKVLSGALAIFAAFALFSCSGDDDDENEVTTVVENVTFTPAAGEVDLDIPVTLATATEGADIYYEFVAESGTVSLSKDNYAVSETIKKYSADAKPVIEAAGTYYAIAVKEDVTSEITSAAYTLSSSVRPAKFSLEDGEYASTEVLAVTTAETDGAIYVKFVPASETPAAPVTAAVIYGDGTESEPFSSGYSAQLPNEDGTIYAVVKKGEEFSAVKSFTFTLIPADSIRTYASENEARTEFAVYNYKDLLKLAELVNGGNTLSGVTIFQDGNIIINENLLDEEFNAPAEAEACKPNANFLSFEGIGSKSKPFSGTYDGDSWMISGAYVYGGHSGIGIFGGVSGAIIKNVIVLDSCVVNKNANAEDESDDDRIGGLVGCVTGNGATVENCVFVGTVGSAEAMARGESYQYMGGIVGAADGALATVTNSCALVKIIGKDSNPLVYKKGSSTPNPVCTGSFAVDFDGNFSADGINKHKFNIEDKIAVLEAVESTYGEDGAFINELLDVIPLETIDIGFELGFKGIVENDAPLDAEVEYDVSSNAVSYEYPKNDGAETKSAVISIEFITATEGITVTVDGEAADFDTVFADGLITAPFGQDAVTKTIVLKKDGYNDTSITITAIPNADMVPAPADSVRKIDFESGVKTWKVYEAKDLVKLAKIVNDGNSLSGYIFEQAADIKFNDKVLGDDWSAPLEASAGVPNADLVVFDGIGLRKKPFSGTYDGQGYEISGLYIYGAHEGLGFIGDASGATIKNVIIKDACVVNANVECNASKTNTPADDGSDDDRFGGLIGCLYNGNVTVENCVFVGTVGSEEALSRGGSVQYVGGLIGRPENADNTKSSATNCVIVAKINANDNGDVICVKDASKMTFDESVKGYTPDEYATSKNTIDEEIAAVVSAAKGE